MDDGAVDDGVYARDAVSVPRRRFLIIAATSRVWVVTPICSDQGVLSGDGTVRLLEWRNI